MSIWIDARMPLLVTAAGRKARELSLSADKIPLLRKNFRGIVVENYRQQQPRKPGGEQTISP